MISDGKAVGGNPLDRALWQAPDAERVAAGGATRLDVRPFDFQRRLRSVLVQEDGGERRVIVKGAPEAVMARSTKVAPQAQAVLQDLFAQGSRVVAVATRRADGRTRLTADDEQDLELEGFLTFLDPPKADAGDAVAALRRLGVEVKVITGDNDVVARNVCADIGLEVRGTITGSELDRLDDRQLADALPNTTIFARATPEQKSRLIKAQRQLGTDVGFMGDGVNDAVALHDADCGISVQTATDVARDAADIVLLDKDLGILADGIAEGRRTFANTMKYVMMGTSSNFGNMFSAGAASLFLSFLPMLPTQILLNNLLYDVSEMTIPTDHVDPEQLEKPAHWDIRMIRRFMLFFGPISSLFDFATFGIMLGVFDAHRSAVPLRVVRRVAGHAEPRDLRHPHTPSPVLSQPGQQAADAHHAALRGNRRLPSVLGARARAGVPASAGGFLRVPRRDGHRLPRAGRDRQDDLLRPHAGGSSGRGPDPAQAGAPSRLALERPEGVAKGPAAPRRAPRRGSHALASSLVPRPRADARRGR